MFKSTAPLQRALRRLALTTKQGPKGYYKGNRTGTVGRHTKRGGFLIDYKRVRTYVVPRNLDKCPLTPFVAKMIEKEKWRREDNEGEGPKSAKLYLQRWKEQNGET